jgi:excisionase family DNA binding protein
MTNSPLLQVRSAAARIGIHENTLRRWEKAGYIQAVRLPSGVRRFREADVEALRAAMYETPVDHPQPTSVKVRGADHARS